MANYVPRYVRVYLLDDHDIVRRGLRDLLVPAWDISVVGESGSARDAARAILELGVDVMVLDLRLQDGTGIEVCREVRSVDPSIAGLLLTSSGDDEALVAAVLAGAAGYVVKLTRSSDIISAIRRVGSGKSLIDRVTADRVTGQLLSGLDQLSPPLADDERAILIHVVHGLTNDQIAGRMGLSLGQATREITRLVERIIRPAFAEGSTSQPLSPGEHGRLDG